MCSTVEDSACAIIHGGGAHCSVPWRTEPVQRILALITDCQSMRGADDALKCDFFIPLFIPRLHDPANVQQISSKRRAISTRILNTLLEVCWTFAGSCKRGIYFVDVV